MTQAGRTPFGVLCQAVYKRGRPHPSRQAFATALIKATGASTAGISDDALRKYCSGTRAPSTVAFPDKLNHETLTGFFRDCVELRGSTDEQRNARCAEIASNLESPISEPIDRERFYRALAIYTDDVVRPNRQLAPFASDYSINPEMVAEASEEALAPLHPGDHVTNFSDGRRTPLALSTYERANYTFLLMNDGNLDWAGRTLRCINADDDWLRPDPPTLEVPFTAPSRARRIQIPLVLAAQHMEGKACSRWVMLDEHGNDCFPKNPDLFTISATITFTADEEDAS